MLIAAKIEGGRVKKAIALVGFSVLLAAAVFVFTRKSDMIIAAYDPRESAADASPRSVMLRDLIGAATRLPKPLKQTAFKLHLVDEPGVDISTGCAMSSVPQVCDTRFPKSLSET